MIYFDNAATTYPKPRQVYERVEDCIKHLGGNPGRGGHSLSVAAGQAVYACRKKLADYFGAPYPENVCFTVNCTHALNTVIKGLVRPFSHVITSDIEHNSVIRPLYDVRGAVISRFDAFAPEDNIILDIDSLIRRDTKLVICTHTSNTVPVTLPIRRIGELCKARGIIFAVDAAQAAGIADIDMTRDCIDILCVPAHKGLYGITGCGVMITSSPRIADEIAPFVYGGSGVNSTDISMPDVAPEKFEAGTLPTVAIAGLSAGLDYIMSFSHGQIAAHGRQLSERIYSRMSDDKRITIYKGHGGSTLLFNVIGKNCEQVAKELDRYGICTRAGLHCAPEAHKKTATDNIGAVRISFSVFNTLSQADRFCDVLSHIIKA